MEFALSPDLLALRDEACKVGLAAAERAEVPEDTWITGHDRGLRRGAGHPRLAGHDLARRARRRPAGSVLERFVVFEALISVGAPIAAAWFADRQMGPTLLQFGTDEQRARWLPGIVDGHVDVVHRHERARRRVERRRHPHPGRARRRRVGRQRAEDLDLGGVDADWCYLIARTDPDAQPHEGLSEFVVDMRAPGVSVKPILDMTGSRHFCEVFFEDVRVPADNLVGELNGSFRQVMRQMEHERGGIDRLVSNRRLYDDVRPLADTSDPLGPPGDRGHRDRVPHRPAARAARDARPGPAPGSPPPPRRSAPSSSSASPTSAAGCSGPETMLAEPGLDRRVSRNICYAPGYTIMGGTTQILRNILGERILGLPREPRPA